MDSRRLCAYNQTRECFLGLEVASVDLASAELKTLIRKLSLKSGEGLWMSPFRGLPDTDMRAPLDLIYLDKDCRVVDVVESFPTFHVNPLSPRSASVLALPLHSIYSSQTQSGDQLVLCVAEEMQGRLERITSTGVAAGTVQSAVLLREKPLWSGGIGVAELEDLSKEEPLKSEPTYQMDLIQPGMKYIKPPKNWLKRWWSPDPRKAPDQSEATDHREAPRESPPGLAAYYWTGAAPSAHCIKDISASGLYVVTEERWYPGTLILMTLKTNGGGEEGHEYAIAVHSKAIRWGNDGVGLQFIPLDAPAARSGLNPLENGANRVELEQFLVNLRNGKG